LALRVCEIVDHASGASFAERLDYFGADAARAASHKHNFIAEIEVGHF
jgi:hypothetical protein